MLQPSPVQLLLPDYILQNILGPNHTQKPNKKKLVLGSLLGTDTLLCLLVLNTKVAVIHLGHGRYAAPDRANFTLILGSNPRMTAKGEVSS